MRRVDIRRNVHHRRLLCEPLEDRRLLSVASSALELFGLSPALFVENQGQWADESVRYAFFGSGANVLHTDTGPVFQLFDNVAQPSPNVAQPPSAGEGNTPDDPTGAFHAPYDLPGETCEAASGVTRSTQFSVSFDGSNVVKPVGLDRAETVFNYHVGEQADWRSGVPTFETVAYQDLYDGIDLLTWGRRDSLKYEFHVDPGVDYRQILVSYEGIDGLWLDDDGTMHVETTLGELLDPAPYIYQVIDGEQVEVAGRLELIDTNTYSFMLSGQYDPRIELIIDPDLAWSTYLGGSSEDRGKDIAVDGAGNGWVTGTTHSPGWVSRGYDASYNGNRDAFVAKLSSNGAHLWSTYLGGNSREEGHGIAVDGAGNGWVVGWTESSGWVSGGHDVTFNGGHVDAFVVKLASDGSHLWSTYLGGSDWDYGDSIAVDGAGNGWVVGHAKSSGWTSGGYDTTHNGWSDAFVVKLSSNGAHLWSTYLGGSDYERGRDIAVDGAGNGWVVGNTNSSGWVSGGHDTTLNSSESDAFVVKLSSDGAHLWSTYLGGGSFDSGHAIAVDGALNGWVTGLTNSSGWVSGGHDVTFDGYYDGFVVKLSNVGVHLWSTYLGGSNYDYGAGIAVDGAGNGWVTGNTNSSGWVSGGFDTTYNGGGSSLPGGDAFVVNLLSNGAHLWSTYLGGSGYDAGVGIVVDGALNGWVTGSTESSGWVSGGYDTTYSGDGDAFVFRFKAIPGDANWDGVVNDQDASIMAAHWQQPGMTWADGDFNGDRVVNDQDSSILAAHWQESDEGEAAVLPDEPKDELARTLPRKRALARPDRLEQQRPIEHIVGDPGSNWSTYLGGSSNDEGYGIAVDGAGNTYVTGYTYSSGWVSGGHDTSHNGGYDAFVAKFSSNGKHLWSTYLGGSGDDYGRGIAVDGAGNAYVSGYTKSSGWVSGGHDTSFNGNSDAFVAKLSSNGAHLWSTYLGGNSWDKGRGIAVDGTGNAYVTGYTCSSGWISGGHDTSYNGGDDAFVAKLSSGGAHLWSTYLGGNDSDSGNGIAVDAAGNAYVTGETMSSGWVSGGYDASYNGGLWDAFAVKLSIDGAHLWSTYLGGSSTDGGYGIAVDGAGNAYVTGLTWSSGWVSGGYDTSYGGNLDAFAAKLSSNGKHLFWSTYLGGSGWEYGSGIVVNDAGNAYVTGGTGSLDWVSGGYDTTHNGDRDAFVAKLSSDGAHLWSTYLGGSNYDFGKGIAVDDTGNAYVTGRTESAGWVSGGHDTTYNGARDGFVYRLKSIPGDANWDGVVNDQDASILAAHWQQSGMAWTDGDFNGDRKVNDQDSSILAAHWQEGAEGEGSAPVEEGEVAVEEPAAAPSAEPGRDEHRGGQQPLDSLLASPSRVESPPVTHGLEDLHDRVRANHKNRDAAPLLGSEDLVRRHLFSSHTLAPRAAWKEFDDVDRYLAWAHAFQQTPTTRDSADHDNRHHRAVDKIMALYGE